MNTKVVSLVTSASNSLDTKKSVFYFQKDCTIEARDYYMFNNKIVINGNSEKNKYSRNSFYMFFLYILFNIKFYLYKK